MTTLSTIYGTITNGTTTPIITFTAPSAGMVYRVLASEGAGWQDAPLDSADVAERETYAAAILQGHVNVVIPPHLMSQKGQQTFTAWASTIATEAKVLYLSHEQEMERAR